MEYCIYCGKKLENGEQVCPSCQHEIKEYKSITDYHYQPLPTPLADEIENGKNTILGIGSGTKKKFVEAIRTGNAGIIPVMVEKVFDITERRDEDDYDTYYYANISDMEGYPASEAPRIMDNIEHISENQQEYLLTFKLGKRQDYIIIDQDVYDGLATNFLAVINTMHINLEKRDMPILEGSLLDRGDKLISGLFGKIFKKK